MHLQDFRRPNPALSYFPICFSTFKLQEKSVAGGGRGGGGVGVGGVGGGRLLDKKEEITNLKSLN